MGKHKYILVEGVKQPQDVDPKLIKNLESKYGKFNMEHDFFSDDLKTYYKTIKVNKTTGSVDHKLIPIASFGDTLKKLHQALKSISKLSKTDDGKKDPQVAEIHKLVRKAFNTFRTHIRKSHPEQYSDIKNLIGEISTTSSVGSYSTKYAFKLPKGYKKTKLQEMPQSLFKTYDEVIDFIKSEVQSKGYELNPKDLRKIELSAVPKPTYGLSRGWTFPLDDKINIKIQIWGVGKVFSVNIAFTTNPSFFKENREGSAVSKFHQERIQAFGLIEQEMNDIYKILSNAKNETSAYYKDNPTSFDVVKPTDLVLDYIKDIKNLLNKEE